MLPGLQSAVGVRLIRRASVIAALGVLLALGWSTPAAAHNALVGADPQDGATMEQGPAAVSLRFLSTLDQNGTVVTVTGPDGAAAEGGEPEVDGATVTVPVSADLPGTYTVAYEVMSSDGHLVTGEVAFTVTVGNPPPSPTPPAPASPTAAPSHPADASPEASAAPQATAEPERSRPWWPIVVVGVMVVLGVVSSVELIRRRAR